MTTTPRWQAFLAKGCCGQCGRKHDGKTKICEKCLQGKRKCAATKRQKYKTQTVVIMPRC